MGTLNCEYTCNQASCRPFCDNICIQDYWRRYWESEISDPPEYKSPIPWVGLYVAAASLLCTLAMAADAFLGFRHKKFWFPCKFFTLNAASLTILAIAMKMPMDLTTSMDGQTDQLAKLSSTVFMSTVMVNFMPSLGPMNNKEIFTSVIALAILAVTIIVNVCIQLGTGLIFPTFLVILVEQSLVICCILVLLVILSFTALAIPTTKNFIDLRYGEIQKPISSEQSEETRSFIDEKLKEDVKKFWMMAETGSPQFVVARSVTCSASGVICFLTAFILAEAVVRISLMYPYAFLTSGCHSDYKWSTRLMFLIQSIGVVIGTIAPVCRWFIVIKLKRSRKAGERYKTVFKTEHYWIEKLVEWKERPLNFPIQGQKCKKLVHNIKNLILAFCIVVQIVIVVVSKSVLLISILFINPLLSCYQYSKGLKRKLKSRTSALNNHTGPGSDTDKNLDFIQYVLNLEGEGELPKGILKNICDTADHLIRMGNRKQPKYLLEFLKKWTDFKSVMEFDSDQVPTAKPRNCWSLPVATLSSIAIALPNVEDRLANSLLHSVSEGLALVKVVEKTLDPKGDLLNIRNAADVVWSNVELYRKWLDEDLQEIAVKGKTSMEILQNFSNLAMNKAIELKRNMNGGPIKVIATDSMYRISQTLLQNLEGGDNQTNERLFEQLSVMIADILGACLTNLPQVITTLCFCNAIEKREESVQHAAHLLGKLKKF